MLLRYLGAGALALALITASITPSKAAPPGPCKRNLVVMWAWSLRIVKCLDATAPDKRAAKRKHSAADMTDVSAAKRIREPVRRAGDLRLDLSGRWDTEAPRRPAHEFRSNWSDAAQAGEITDVSAARRIHRVRPPDRAPRLHRQRYRGDPCGTRCIARSTSPMDAIGTDRDGRGSVAADRPSRDTPPRIRARHASLGPAGPQQSGQVVDHPVGCPRTQFCGCGVAVHIFGAPLRALWLAANWLRYPRAEPAPGMVAARPGHVFAIERVLGNGLVLAYDPNSGRHLTRVHVRSIAGFRVVNPRG